MSGLRASAFGLRLEDQLCEFFAESRRPKPALLSLPAAFCDVHDLMLKNEKIGSAFAREPHHVLIVILDPSAHGLTIQQLHADRLLLLAQSLKKVGLLESLLGRRGAAAFSGVGISMRAERGRGVVNGGAGGT